MKLYCDIDANGILLRLATDHCSFGSTVIEQTEDIDLTKLNGYRLTDGQLVFDEDLYNGTIEQAKKEEAVETLSKFKNELTDETFLEMLTDEQALKVAVLYPEWEPGVEYKKDQRIQKDGTLYKIIKDHTSQEDWGLDNSLYTVINESNDGTDADPIPYSGNMELEEGKCYIQDGVVYLCTRDTGIPVYNDLKDLVGIYVSELEA